MAPLSNFSVEDKPKRTGFVNMPEIALTPWILYGIIYAK